MESVELRPAYEWTCPDCGQDNFVRCVVSEMSPEEEAELRESSGIEAEASGSFVAMPDMVQCRHCDEEFESQHFGLDP